ncbi:universal stress protein [Flexithrix dorotheae]|uniref:universal stress protein n=1 Tax=Flexithrix dorotheae TaxID=70993 RepID=UPI00036AAAB6|nr:universal stress protein [Flexithrix dorotheae]
MEAFKYRPFQIALVGLDLTEMDDHVISFVAMISEILPLERVFFMYVAKELELPKEVLEKYPALLAPLDESIQMDLKQKVDKYFKDSKVETECLVKDGEPIDKILKLAKVKHVDLIVMGRKKSLKGSGIVSSRIARKCPSSLLLVPENSSQPIKKVLIPVDFSRHAALSIKQGVRFVKNAFNDIELVHIYAVPTGYSKVGKSYQEFAKIIKGHAMNKCANFLRENGFPSDIKCNYILEAHSNKGVLLHNHAVDANTDLIVIGSRGRTRASSILIGSCAEKLVFHDSDIPVLIVKNQGENMDFLKAILRI